MRGDEETRVMPAPLFASSPKRVKDPVEGDICATLHSSGGALNEETAFIRSSDGKRGTSNQGEKQRISKLDKIRELLNENRQLKDEAFHLKHRLKHQKKVRFHDSPAQLLSGEATKEEHASKEKHMEASLRALTAVTKTQQESLAAHHERSEALVRELDERDVECKRLRQELDKKKQQVAMLKKMIDLDLVEITSLRKEVTQARKRYTRSEAEIRGDDRRKIQDLVTTFVSLGVSPEQEHVITEPMRFTDGPATLT